MTEVEDEQSQPTTVLLDLVQLDATRWFGTAPVKPTYAMKGGSSECDKIQRLTPLSRPDSAHGSDVCSASLKPGGQVQGEVMLHTKLTPRGMVVYGSWCLVGEAVIASHLPDSKGPIRVEYFLNLWFELSGLPPTPLHKS